SFVGGRNEVDASHIKPVVNVNANWACVMPFGFMRNLETPEIQYNIDRQWWGERRVGATKTARLFQAEGVKVMVKPQIWIWKGEFTGLIEMKTEDDWKAFEGNYEKFILEYADMAREINADILCIGTELNKFVNARPEFWGQLLTKIKKIYKGRLTYAENWDTFDKVPFWNELDYVGVDAYFPLCENQTPTLETLKLGWKNHKPKIVALQKQLQKPVLFTEYGYRSVDYSGKRPWDFSREMNGVNLAAQENGLKAIYEEFWKEDWFAGGFLWKWYDNHERSGGND
ncbi:unnamed protein product, partial [Ectocarpus sp. 4 AP-2014]